MRDELDEIRSLRGDPPPPSDGWVQETRAELLAMAEEERREHTAVASPPARLRDRLVALLGGRRPLALAGAAALTAVVAVGAALLAPSPEQSTDPIAQPTRSPAATPTTTPGSPAAPPDPTAPTDATGPATSTAPSPDAVVLGSSCAGGDGTYTIGYPEGWHTNRGEVASPCEHFDEEPVELEAGTGGTPEHPVVIEVVPRPFADATQPTVAFEEASRTPTTVDGRDAVVAVWRSTGAGGYPEGMRSYRYLIDLDGERTLVVAAEDLGDDTWDDHRLVVDAMVDSLELSPR